MAGPPTEEWTVMNVAHNNTRGSSQRLREKREKIRQATHCPSLKNNKSREPDAAVHDVVSSTTRPSTVVKT